MKETFKRGMLVVLMVAIFGTLCACGSSSRSSSSNYSSSNSTTKKCGFIENGKSTCSSPAASGSNFCSYHKGYLDSIYEGFVGK